MDCKRIDRNCRADVFAIKYIDFRLCYIDDDVAPNWKHTR